MTKKRQILIWEETQLKMTCFSSPSEYPWTTSALQWLDAAAEGERWQDIHQWDGNDEEEREQRVAPRFRTRLKRSPERKDQEKLHGRSKEGEKEKAEPMYAWGNNEMPTPMGNGGGGG